MLWEIMEYFKYGFQSVTKPSKVEVLSFFSIFGHTLRLVGSYFSDQGLNLGDGRESAES